MKKGKSFVAAVVRRLTDDYNDSMNDLTGTSEVNDFLETAVERGMEEMRRRCAEAVGRVAERHPQGTEAHDVLDRLRAAVLTLPIE